MDAYHESKKPRGMYTVLWDNFQTFRTNMFFIQICRKEYLFLKLHIQAVFVGDTLKVLWIHTIKINIGMLSF